VVLYSCFFLNFCCFLQSVVNKDIQISVLGDTGRTTDLTDMPGLTVYRSYGSGGLTQLTATSNGDAGRMAVVGDSSVPDIKIYRRSAVLYDGDDDNDMLHHSSYRSVLG